MFGAGVFALPFAIAQSGVLWGVIHLLIVLVLTTFLLFLYAEITYYTEGKHRFTGYVEKFLGKKYKLFSFLVVLGSYYSTLLAYAILGGVFLSSFFENISASKLSLIFLVVGSFLILLRLGKIALVNFYLTIPLFGFVGYLFYTAVPFMDLNNLPLTLNGFSTQGAWFLPYGVWLFSFGAMAAIPETRDIFEKSSVSSFKKTILISVILSAIFYCLFVLSILGVSGHETSKDALSGVLGVLGSRVILIGSAMGFLAIFTSFLALGIDLRDIFRYDYSVPKRLAWFLVILPPFILYFLGVQNFTLIISLVGAIGGGVGGILLVLMSYKFVRLARANLIRKSFRIVALAAFLVAIVYEAWNLFI